MKKFALLILSSLLLFASCKKEPAIQDLDFNSVTNPKGSVYKISVYSVSDGVRTLSYETIYENNSNGNPITAKREKTSSMSDYDAKYEYDENGNNIYYYYTSGKNRYEYKYSYDSDNKLIEKKSFSNSKIENRRTYEYNSDGTLDRENIFKYKDDGTEYQNSYIPHTYDENKNCISYKNVYTNGSVSQIFTQIFDSKNNKIESYCTYGGDLMLHYKYDYNSKNQLTYSKYYGSSNTDYSSYEAYTYENDLVSKITRANTNSTLEGTVCEETVYTYY